MSERIFSRFTRGPCSRVYAAYVHELPVAKREDEGPRPRLPVPSPDVINRDGMRTTVPLCQQARMHKGSMNRYMPYSPAGPALAAASPAHPASRCLPPRARYLSMPFSLCSRLVAAAMRGDGDIEVRDFTRAICPRNGEGNIWHRRGEACCPPGAVLHTPVHSGRRRLFSMRR